MNKLISVAALLAAAVAICLIGYERAERRRAISEALAQREALMVQRYARLIGQMAEELGGGRGREDATIEEAIEDLREAVRRLELTRYEERRELPPTDGGANALEPARVVEPVSDVGAAASRTERLEMNPADPPKTVNTFVVASKPPAGAAPALAPSAGRIVMVERSDAGNRELVLLSAEGKDRRQLTWHVPKVDEAAAAAAAAAADGARPDGEEAGEAAPPAAPEPVVYADNIDPCWRDDHTIVFASNRTGNAELWSLDLDTDETTRLTNTPGTESSPAASLSGRLAWTYRSRGDQAFSAEIVIESDDASKEPKRLGYADHASWSPDGGRIAFTDPGSTALCVDSIAGAEDAPKYLLFADFAGATAAKPGERRSIGQPKWSPDGRSILYTLISTRIGPSKEAKTITRVNIVNVDDEKKHGPAFGNDDEREVEIGIGWSADGRRIMFIAQDLGDEQPELMTANIDGGEPRTLVRMNAASVSRVMAAWEPAFLVKPPATASGNAAIASSRHKGNRPR